jgi:nitroreductase
MEGNVLVVLSAAGDGKTNAREILDCALSAQSMYLAAQALGHSSRIYTGPIETINKTLKGELGLPRDHNAIVLVRIGKAAAVDAATSASPRKSADEVVFWK